MMLSDGVIGQMMEKVELPDPIPRRTDEELIKRMPLGDNRKTKDQGEKYHHFARP